MKTIKQNTNSMNFHAGKFQESSQFTLGKPERKNRRCCSCFFCLGFPVVFLIFVTIYVYIFAPGRTNILIMGIDSRDHSTLGRSDTIIMTTYIPSPPYVGMLSIPRDLWVEIPGYGYNRINTANFFAEADQLGSGPQLAIQTINTNFGVNVDYYIRIDFIGFLDLVDALGGIEVDLPYPTAGYSEGKHNFNGEQTLAFVRDRKNSDDFFRMERGQIILKALISRMLYPPTWLKLPETTRILTSNMETDFPLWQWPQLAITFLQVGSNNIDARTINREMISPFTTEGGANVLAPIWEEINPILMEMFEQ